MPKRRLLYIIIAILATTATVSLILSPVGAGWQRFRNNFLYGLAYANCIGWPAWLLGPQIGSRTARMRPLARWAVVVASLTIMGVVGSLLALSVLAGSGMIAWSQYWVRFRGGLQLNLVVTLVTGTGFFMYESLRYRSQYETARARVASLESRLQPHFLFNTLNSISALIPDDPKAADQMIGRLAALLRFSLDATDRHTVQLDRELKVMTDYLQIEKARFGNRLQYSIDVPRELWVTQVPPFSLQTLVENSVKHGGNEIRVTGRNGNGLVLLNVWDSGKGFAKDAFVPGHGLENLRSRLNALWGSSARLDIHHENSGTTVTLTLPAESIK
jgi:signal transduction histidine kinase